MFQHQIGRSINIPLILVNYNGKYTPMENFMGVSSGFFYNPPKERERFEDVGGDQFRAAAVAVINYFRTRGNTKKNNDSSLNTILEALFRQYPLYKQTLPPYMTNVDRMDFLTQKKSIAKLVDNLAHVLQILAVDELLANPTEYKEVLLALPKEEDLRSVGNIAFHYSIFKALARAIKIQISLSFQAPQIDLRKKVIFGESDKDGLELQVQGNYYFPKIRGDATYANQSLSSIKPIASGEIAHAQALIARDNQQLKTQFGYWTYNLSAMITANELNYEQLRSGYIRFLPSSNFSSRLGELVKPEPVTFKNPAEYKTQLLIQTLAELFANKQIDPDSFFDFIEHKAEPQIMKPLR